MSPSPRVHCGRSGFPSVVPSKPRRWLRSELSVYESVGLMKANGLISELNDGLSVSEAVSCRARTRRSDIVAPTAENCCVRRDSAGATTPLAGTTLDGETKTGRFPSPGKVNCCVPAKLRSTTLGWRVPSEYNPPSE